MGFALEIPLKSCSKRLARAAKSGSLVARPLWEGSPELPVLPSPWAYRLLLEVVQSMTELGTDVWSPQLSRELKNELSRSLNDVFQKSAVTAEATGEAPAAEINGYANGETNGEKNKAHEEKLTGDEETKDAPHENGEGNETSEKESNGTHVNGDGSSTAEDDSRVAKDKKTQRLFDVLYLTYASSTSLPEAQNGQNLDEIQASLEKELELEVRSLERMRRDAGEYWKRTKSLFALLQE